MSDGTRGWFIERTLIDFYSMLGVKRSASRDEIDSAFRNLIRQYHPDRYVGLAPQFCREAERMSALLGTAVNVLRDIEQKAAYDEALVRWEGPVSSDGLAVMVIGSSYISAFSLLSDTPESISEASARARLMIGYEENMFEVIESAYNAAADPPDKLRSAYAEALANRDLYLSIEEMLLWETVGRHNRSEGRAPVAYIECVEAEIAEVRRKVVDDLDQKFALIYGGQLLLKGPTGEQISRSLMESPQQTLELWRERVVARFDSRVQRLRELAVTRQQVIEARLKLLVPEYKPAGQPLFPDFAIQARLPQRAAWFVFSSTEDHIRSAENLISPEELARLEELEVAESVVARGINVICFTPCDDVDLKDQLSQVASAHHAAFWVDDPDIK